MRCPYCHNPELVKAGRGRLAETDILAFLESRRGLLDGVVLSGGEATLYPGILAFASKIREKGLAVKLDTNGTRPVIIKALLDDGLLDYIALDYKAPAAKFKAVTKCNAFDAFQTTLDMLCRQKSIPVEIRTTVHTDILDEADVASILSDLQKHGFCGTYAVQNFTPPSGGRTLGRLGQQSRELKRCENTNSKNFQIRFRNFPPIPVHIT